MVISTEDKPQEVDDLIYAVEYPGIVRTPKNDFAKFRVRRLICRVCKLKFRTRQETQEHIRREHSGSADGILQKFDSIKYQACGLFTNAQKAYSDGFVMRCTQIGNTQLICQALADTSELNMKTQLTQTQTAIQPTQAIQPATIGG